DIVGTPGSLEDAIGDCTVHARSGGRFTSTEQLVCACRAGDPRAREVWERSVQRLAVGLASLVNVLDPEVIVIGGGIALAGDALFDPLRVHLDRIEWRPLGSGVAIVPAALGEFAGALGAARHVFHGEDA
ncbi:MAG: ROK family protein, partial [Gemmatimonadaceae bacterium]